MGGPLAAVRARRAAQREAMLERARAHVDDLARRLPVREAAVIGSVARGDFNAWSDIDVVAVIDPPLPARAPDRLALVAGAPGIQTWAYTPGELTIERARRNAAVLELDGPDVVWLRRCLQP